MVLSELTASAAAMRSLHIGENPSVGVVGSVTPLKNRSGESSNPFVRSFESSLVAWQQLNEESVERAKAEGKLLFLHIGYKACHCKSSRRAINFAILCLTTICRLPPNGHGVICKC